MGAVHQLAVVVSAISFLSLGLSAKAGVRACADSDGRLTYTQFACPSGTQEETLGSRHTPLSIIDGAALSEAERSALERLERTLKAERTDRAQDNRRAARRRAVESAETRARCEQARQALATLARTRRKGYSVADSRRLDAEEAHWDAVSRADC